MPIISQNQTKLNSFFGKKRRRCIKAARRAAEGKDAAQGDSDRGAGARDLRAEGPRGFGGARRNLRHLAQGGPGHLEREVGVPLPCLCVWPSAEGGGSQDVERRQCVCAAEEGPRRPEEGQRRSFEEEPHEERHTPLSTDELDMPLHLMLWCRILKTRKHVMDQIQAQPPALDTLQTFFEMCMQGDVHQCQIVLEEIHQYCKSRIQFKRNLCSLPCEKPTFFGAIGPPTT